MSSVAVIDYGMGNLHSISKALQKVAPEADIQIVSDADKIRRADRIVFPGVGAIRDCIEALQSRGLDRVIKEVVKEKPFLGICLGMQALLTESEENGHTPCLDVFSGQVNRFASSLTDHNQQRLKIPHMGWNKVHFSPHPLWNGIEQDSRFYFVHSYFVNPETNNQTIATSHYPDEFCCAIAKDNVFAVQFHPEKSQHVGLKLLENFMAWDGTV